jgi:hypothetical protein
LAFNNHQNGHSTEGAGLHKYGVSVTQKASVKRVFPVPLGCCQGFHFQLYKMGEVTTLGYLREIFLSVLVYIQFLCLNVSCEHPFCILFMYFRQQLNQTSGILVFHIIVLTLFTSLDFIETSNLTENQLFLLVMSYKNGTEVVGHIINITNLAFEARDRKA